MKPLLLAAAVAAFSVAASAQINLPPASPGAKLTQQVGLAEVTVEYSRPGVKGRPIFGGLVRHGQVWRTGANASTKIAFDRDVRFGGEDVPAGTYALYTIPDQRSWTVILSTNTGLWGAGGYDEADDLLRVRAPITRLAPHVESFTIDFQGFHTNGADLVLQWADTQVSVPIVVEADEVIFAQIKANVLEATGSVSAQDYFTAARFYHEQKHDLPQAAKWMDAALSENADAFWMVLARAQLALDMGDREAAKAGALRARELAGQSTQGDFGYIAKSNLLLEKIEADEGGTR